MAPTAITQMLRGEQSQTWALVLGQLDAENSAGVFRTMEAAFRADVMQRMARMEPVSPEVLDRLMKSLLARRSEASCRDYIGANGTQFLTEIMKKFDRQVASDALEALAQNDPELSDSIRKMMFVFEDLVQLDATTMGTILREVDFNTLAMAMKDCPIKLRDMIMKSITKRAAESLEENLKAMSKMRRKEVEEARNKIMEQIFELERNGDISLEPGGSPVPPLDIVLPIQVRRIEKAALTETGLDHDTRMRRALPPVMRKAGCGRHGKRRATRRS